MVAGPAMAQDRPVVAVFPMNGNGTKFTKSDLEAVTDHVATQLTVSGRYQVVPQSDIKRVMRDRVVGDMTDKCVDESCQIEVGKELAAAKAVVGNIRKFGTSCMVNLRLVDLAKSVSERAGAGRGGCKHENVITSIDLALTALTGIRPPPSTALPVQGGGSAVVAPSQNVTGAKPVSPAPVPSPQIVQPTPSATGESLLTTAQRLSATRSRRSFVRRMVKYERAVCDHERDRLKAQKMADAACSSKPNSRICRRNTRRVKAHEDRIQKNASKLKSHLAAVASREGAQFAQQLEAFGLQVRACWCDPQRGSRRACRTH